MLFYSFLPEVITIVSMDKILRFIKSLLLLLLLWVPSNGHSSQILSTLCSSWHRTKFSDTTTTTTIADCPGAPRPWGLTDRLTGSW